MPSVYGCVSSYQCASVVLIIRRYIYLCIISAYHTLYNNSFKNVNTKYDLDFLSTFIPFHMLNTFACVIRHVHLFYTVLPWAFFRKSLYCLIYPIQLLKDSILQACLRHTRGPYCCYPPDAPYRFLHFLNTVFATLENTVGVTHAVCGVGAYVAVRA